MEGAIWSEPLLRSSPQAGWKSQRLVLEGFILFGCLCFIATSFEPYHSSLSSVNIKSKQSAVDQICCTVPKLKQREREIAHIEWLADMSHNFLFFFWHPFQFIAKNILSGCLSFQASVRHISCTKWSSSPLSTNGCYWIDYYHIMLLPWGSMVPLVSFPCPWEAAVTPTPSGSGALSK